MGANDWRVPQNMNDWMRAMEKRLLHEERRPHVSSAADLLGPGQGPTGAHILDWSDDVAAVDGVFYTTAGSLNSPDPSQTWLGETYATQDGQGVQTVWQVGADPPVQKARLFTTDVNGARTYTIWTDVGGGGGGGTTRLTFTFASAIDTWIIDHNLGRTVDVHCYDPSGTNEFYPEIDYPTVNRAVVSWWPGLPMTGTAVVIG